jgi:DNA-binding MarR family transcriptional regulator
MRPDQKSAPADIKPLDKAILALPDEVIVWTQVLARHGLSPLQYELLAYVGLGVIRPHLMGEYEAKRQSRQRALHALWHRGLLTAYTTVENTDRIIQYRLTEVGETVLRQVAIDLPVAMSRTLSGFVARMRS